MLENFSYSSNECNDALFYFIYPPPFLVKLFQISRSHNVVKKIQNVINDIDNHIKYPHRHDWAGISWWRDLSVTSNHQPVGSMTRGLNTIWWVLAGLSLDILKFLFSANKVSTGPTCLFLCVCLFVCQSFRSFFKASNWMIYWLLTVVLATYLSD